MFATVRIGMEDDGQNELKVIDAGGVEHTMTAEAGLGSLHIGAGEFIILGADPRVVLAGQVDALTADKAALAGQVDALAADKAALAGQVDALTADNAALIKQVQDLQAQLAAATAPAGA
ncbi:MAG TPA: hypothetical protein VJ577_11455 [Burkholderiaceae bacterium]|nr:hypothetical protein [Burkholderiaceae bacterium]